MTTSKGKSCSLTADKLIFKVGKILCPFIETSSFGSDIHIQCNSSYLIINEINVSTEKQMSLDSSAISRQADELNWKFANRTWDCDQDGPQQAFVNQCGVIHIGSSYLAVPLVDKKIDVLSYI